MKLDLFMIWIYAVTSDEMMEPVLDNNCQKAFERHHAELPNRLRGYEVKLSSIWILWTTSQANITILDWTRYYIVPQQQHWQPQKNKVDEYGNDTPKAEMNDDEEEVEFDP
ncbi:unnamed protein product [Absidia cylindrospora]